MFDVACKLQQFFHVTIEVKIFLIGLSTPLGLICPILDVMGGEEGSCSVSWEVDVEEEEERRCVRCRKTFFMLKSGTYASYETCSYHWGKLRY